MTKQESFKRRIRARMAETGEPYVVARLALLDQSAKTKAPTRVWVSQPEISEAAVQAATGAGWNEWVEAIESSPISGAGHSAIAEHLQQEFELDGWWAQTVTVGNERIVGIRLPYQRPDGPFTASKSATVGVDAEGLRRRLLDASQRAELFPGVATELRSDPHAKAIRIGIGPGVARISVEDRPGTQPSAGRAKVSVAHERLPDPDSVEQWRTYWADWLATVGRL